MPVDPAAVIPTLIEIGRRIDNAIYLISSVKLGEPDPESLVEVTMFPGSRHRLSDPESREWVAKLSAFVPRESGDACPPATRTLIIPGPDSCPGAEKLPQ